MLKTLRISIPGIVTDALALQAEKFSRLSRSKDLTLRDMADLMEETGRLYLNISLLMRGELSAGGAANYRQKYDGMNAAPTEESHPVLAPVQTKTFPG